MYIQENPVEKERTAPPDYSGHTYVAEPINTAWEPERVPDDVPSAAQEEKSTETGAFSFSSPPKKGGGSGFFGPGGMFSRLPFLSGLVPPPRKCGEGERKHSELWDFVLLAVLALALLNGKEDDVLPLLLLLLLWD